MHYVNNNLVIGRLDGRMRRGLLYDSDDEDDEPARRRRRLAAERAADGRIIDDEVSTTITGYTYLGVQKIAF